MTRRRPRLTSKPFRGRGTDRRAAHRTIPVRPCAAGRGSSPSPCGSVWRRRSVACGHCRRWQLWLRPRATSGSPMQLVHLTTLTGEERGATFSPDGRQVAFTWNGEARANWDIYVKLIGSPEIKQLTTHPARDLAPRWSFDGRHITYYGRTFRGRRARRIIRPWRHRSSAERPRRAARSSWSPDDQWMRSVYRLGRAQRRRHLPLTRGRRATETTDTVSRRGRGLDAGFLTRRPSSGLRLMSRLHEQLSHASDHARCHICGNRTAPATDDGTHGYHRGVTWARNGAFVIFGAIQGPLNECGAPASTRMRRRIGSRWQHQAPCFLRRRSRRIGWYSREVRSMKTCMRWKSAVRSALSPDRPYSTAAPVSPDNKRIAFCSGRAGEATDVWIADADGSHPEQLTHGPGRWQCSPAWSRDGSSVAFNSRGGTGESQIFSIDVERRSRATPKSRAIEDAELSRTRWIYFRIKTRRDICVQRTAEHPSESRQPSGLPLGECRRRDTVLPRAPTIRIHEPTTRR